ncbi:MAG: hypothetical protein U1C48_03995 [Methylotenera sp.]|nr:hypothetical protein [Methylotenera sp.]
MKFKEKEKELRRLINQKAHTLSLLHEIKIKNTLRERLSQLTDAGATVAEIEKAINTFTK